MDIEDIFAVPIIIFVGIIVIMSIQGLNVNFLIEYFDDVIVAALFVAISVGVLRAIVE